MGSARAADAQAMSGEMFRSLPWPFPGDDFPHDLGVLVMRSVLDGAPSLQVVHFPDEDGWGITDGGDPNAPGAVIATHMRHVLELDPTVAALATLPPGHAANRTRAGEAWTISPFTWEE
jgi:hypothetical protein